MGIDNHRDLTAASLAAGNSARIAGLRPGALSAQRLGELGFQPDELISILRSGDPVILEIRGALLAIDRLTAADIELRDAGAGVG